MARIQPFRIEEIDFSVLTDEQAQIMTRAARLEWAESAAAEKDILGWGKAIFPDKFPLPFCDPMHQEMVDHRHDELDSKEEPRNHAKTAIQCFLIPIFQAIYEPDSYHHYLNVQSTGTKAQAVNISIKTELESNDLLLELIGRDLVGKDKWTDKQFVTSDGVIFTAVGAGQSIRGINYLNKRPDYLVIDDLYDESHITNVPATIKLNDWFWGSLYPARAKSRKCSIHIQGTAINHYDLLEKLKKHPRHPTRTHRAITDWDKRLVLWPALNTFDKLMEDMQNMGSLIFMREMQNERTDDATSIVKRSWLYPPDRPSWEYDPADLRFDGDRVLAAVILNCDPSIGEKVQNDATGIALIYRVRDKGEQGDTFYVHAVWNEHLSLDKRLKLLQDIASSQPENRQVNNCRVEAIGAFKDFASEIRRRTNLPLQEIDTVTDKIANLTNKSHFFENGKVKLNKNIPEALKDQVVYQLTTNYPQHDDLRDAVLLGLDSAPRLWSWV